MVPNGSLKVINKMRCVSFTPHTMSTWDSFHLWMDLWVSSHLWPWPHPKYFPTVWILHSILLNKRLLSSHSNRPPANPWGCWPGKWHYTGHTTTCLTLGSRVAGTWVDTASGSWSPAWPNFLVCKFNERQVREPGSTHWDGQKVHAGFSVTLYQKRKQLPGQSNTLL